MADSLDIEDQMNDGTFDDLDNDNLGDVDFDLSEDEDMEPVDHYDFMAQIDAKDAELEQRHNNLLSRQQQLVDWIGSRQRTLEDKASKLTLEISACTASSVAHLVDGHTANESVVSTPALGKIPTLTKASSVPVHGAITLRPAIASDVDAILSVVNDAASAYRGVIPAESWHEPYMGREELLTDTTKAGVNFHLAVTASTGTVVGIMGIQHRRLGPIDGQGDACARAIRMPEVTLIRHAYTCTVWQRRGIGQRLLQHLLEETSTPTLIGTWAATTWAIKFYEKVLVRNQKDMLGM